MAPIYYDETHSGRCYPIPMVLGTSNAIPVMSLNARLEHYSSMTNAIFKIIFNKGQGTIISKNLYESIPLSRRPSLQPTNQKVGFVLGGKQPALGTVFFPIMLMNLNTGVWFRVVLYAFVVEKPWFMMYIDPSWLSGVKVGADGGPEYEWDFGNRRMVVVRGIRS